MGMLRSIFSKREKQRKILIIEDDPDIATGIEIRLSQENFAVVLAANGPDGIEKAKSDPPDLIILDLMLPKMDGYETCKILKQRENTKHVPVLVLTALPLMGDAEKAFAAGADDFLKKPYRNQQLIEKIQKLLPPPSG